jgi:hypothetical protein
MLMPATLQFNSRAEAISTCPLERRTKTSLEIRAVHTIRVTTTAQKAKNVYGHWHGTELVMSMGKESYV